MKRLFSLLLSSFPVLSLLVICLPLAAAAQDTDPSAAAAATPTVTATVVVEMPTELARRMQKQSDLPPVETLPAKTEAEKATETAEADGTELQSSVTRPAPVTRVVGYRVQVYADNNSRTAKGEARQRERALSSSFPLYATYVTYASPYWRLRVGDFRSQYEAEKAADEIRRAFPGYSKEVRVVRDRVNVR